MSELLNFIDRVETLEGQSELVAPKPYSEWSAENVYEDPLESRVRFGDYIREQYINADSYTPEVEQEISMGFATSLRDSGLLLEDGSNVDEITEKSAAFDGRGTFDQQAKYLRDSLSYEDPEWQTLTDYLAAAKIEDPTEEYLQTVERLRTGAKEVVSQNHDRLLEDRVLSGETPLAKLSTGELIVGDTIETMGLSDAIKRSAGAGVTMRDALRVQQLMEIPDGFRIPRYKLERVMEIHAQLKEEVRLNNEFQILTEGLAMREAGTELDLGDRLKRAAMSTVGGLFEGVTNIVGGGIAAIVGTIRGKSMDEIASGSFGQRIEAGKKADQREAAVRGARGTDINELAARYAADLGYTASDVLPALRQVVLEEGVDKGIYKFHKDEDELGRNIRAGGYGLPHLPTQVYLNKDLFEGAIANRPDINENVKDLLSKQRVFQLKSRFQSANDFLGRTHLKDEWQQALMAGHAAGMENHEILDEFLADEDNYNETIERAKGIGMSVVDGVYTLMAAVPAAFENELAMDYLASIPKRKAKQREIAKLFGDEFGFWQEAMETTFPLLTDIAATALLTVATAPAGGVGGVAYLGAKSAVTGGASATAKFTVRGLGKALTSNLFKTSAAGGVREQAEKILAVGAAKGAAKPDLKKQLVKAVDGEAGVDSVVDLLNAYNGKLANVLKIGPTRGIFITSGMRSGGSTYGVVYNQLLEQGVSKEDAHDRALGAGLQAATFTALLTSSFSKIGMGGLESALMRGLSYKQMKAVSEVLKGRLRHMPDKVKVGAAQTEVPLFDKVKESLATLMKKHSTVAGPITGVVKSVAHEGFEEGIDEFVNVLFTDAALHENTPMIERMEQTFRAAALGGVMGGSVPLIRGAARVLRADPYQMQRQASFVDAVINETVSDLEKSDAPKAAQAIRDALAARGRKATARAAAVAAPPAVAPEPVEPTSGPLEGMAVPQILNEAKAADAVPEDGVLTETQKAAIDFREALGAEPVAEPAAEPAAEPVAEPAAEPVAEPTEEPVAEPTEEPVAEPTEEPVAEPPAGFVWDADTGTWREPKLPRDLAGAKPRYSYGQKRFELFFESDIDRAAYITAQRTRSTRDQDYLSFVANTTGMPLSAVRVHGQKVKAEIKRLAKEAAPGTLTIPPMFRAARPANPPESAQLDLFPEDTINPTSVKSAMSQVLAEETPVVSGADPATVRIKGALMSGLGLNPIESSSVENSDHQAVRELATGQKGESVEAKLEPLVDPKVRIIIDPERTEEAKAVESRFREQVKEINQKREFYQKLSRDIEAQSATGTVPAVQQALDKAVQEGRAVSPEAAKALTRQAFRDRITALKEFRVKQEIEVEEEPVAPAEETAIERLIESGYPHILTAAKLRRLGVPVSVRTLSDQFLEESTQRIADQIAARFPVIPQEIPSGGASVPSYGPVRAVIDANGVGRFNNDPASMLGLIEQGAPVEVPVEALTSPTLNPAFRFARIGNKFVVSDIVVPESGGLVSALTSAEHALNLREDHTGLSALIRRVTDLREAREGEPDAPEGLVELLITSPFNPDEKITYDEAMSRVSTDEELNPFLPTLDSGDLTSALRETALIELKLRAQESLMNGEPVSLVAVGREVTGKYMEIQAARLKHQRETYVATIALDEASNLQNNPDFAAAEEISDPYAPYPQEALPQLPVRKISNMIKEMQSDAVAAIAADPALRRDVLEIIQSQVYASSSINFSKMTNKEAWGLFVQWMAQGNNRANSASLTFQRDLKSRKYEMGEPVRQALQIMSLSSQAIEGDPKTDPVYRGVINDRLRELLGQEPDSGQTDEFISSVQKAAGDLYLRSQPTSMTRAEVQAENLAAIAALGLETGNPDSILEALRRIIGVSDRAETDYDAHLVALARLLIQNPSFINDIAFTIDETGLEYAGRLRIQDDGTRAISININGHNPRGVADTLLHELTHAYVSGITRKPEAELTRQERSALRTLEGLIARVKDQFAYQSSDALSFTGGIYVSTAFDNHDPRVYEALENTDEFIAHFLTSTEFQQAVKVLSDPARAIGTPRSMFQRIVDAILGLFNIQRTQYPQFRKAFSAVLDLSHAAVFAGRPSTRREVDMTFDEFAALQEEGLSALKTIPARAKSFIANAVFPAAPVIVTTAPKRRLTADNLASKVAEEVSNSRNNGARLSSALQGATGLDVAQQRRLDAVKEQYVEVARRLSPPEVEVVVDETLDGMAEVDVESGAMRVNPEAMIAFIESIVLHNGGEPVPVAEIIGVVLNEEHAHAASVAVISEAEINVLIDQLTEEDAMRTINDYGGGGKIKETREKMRRGFRDNNRVVKLQIVEEMLRQHAQRVIRGFTTEENVLFLAKNPGARPMVTRYFKSLLNRMGSNKTRKQFSPQLQAAITRIVAEIRGMEAGYVYHSNMMAFDPNNPTATLEQLRKQLGMNKSLEPYEEPRRAAASGLGPVAEIDANYMAAVEAGDMETAQRMVNAAALAAGYDTSTVYFHGTLAAFDVPDLETQRGLHEVDLGVRPFWGTDMEELAEDFAGKNRVTKAGWEKTPEKVRRKFRVISDDGKIVTYIPKDGRVMRLFFKKSRPEDFFRDFNRAAYDEELVTSDLREAIKEGQATYEFENIKDGSYISPAWKVSNQVVALQPGAAKSAEPVTRDADGNVIPLSQRFDPTQESILRSGLGPAESSFVDAVKKGNQKAAQKLIDGGVTMNRDLFLAIDIRAGKTQNPRTTIHKALRERGVISKEDYEDGRGLVYGDGTGGASKALGADSFEPFPPDTFTPTYTGDRAAGQGDSIDKQYPNILNTFVLNVVEPQTREFILKDIANHLEVGGEAVVVTRGKDVAGGAAPFLKFGELEVIRKRSGELTYQKGFTKTELKKYAEETLGEGFTVTTPTGAKVQGSGRTTIVITKNEDVTLDNPPLTGGAALGSGLGPVTKGIYINDKNQSFTEQILDGEKTIETRPRNTLKSFLGQRVGIIRSGKKGKSVVVGYATIGDEPIVYPDIESFRADEDKHLVKEGSKFDTKGKKYGYVLSDVAREPNPYPISKKGNRQYADIQPPTALGSGLGPELAPFGEPSDLPVEFRPDLLDFDRYIRLLEIPIAEAGPYKRAGKFMSMFVGDTDPVILRLMRQRDSFIKSSGDVLDNFHADYRAALTKEFGEDIPPEDDEFWRYVQKATGTTDNVQVDPELEDSLHQQKVAAKIQADIDLRNANRGATEEQKKENGLARDAEIERIDEEFESRMTAARMAAVEVIKTERNQSLQYLKDNHNEIYKVVLNVRALTDSLSDAAKQAFGQHAADIGVKFDTNMGIYITRRYEMFSDPSYVGMILEADTQEAINIRMAAIEYMRDFYIGTTAKSIQAKAEAEGEPISTDAARVEAEAQYNAQAVGTQSLGEVMMIEFLRSFDTATGASDFGNAFELADAPASIVGRGQNGLSALVENLQGRSEIPEPLANLMGANNLKQDSIDNLLYSFGLVARIAAHQSFLNAVKAQGVEGGWLFSAKEYNRKRNEENFDPKLEYKKIAADKADDGLNPLAGMYTSPEIYEDLKIVFQQKTRSGNDAATQGVNKIMEHAHKLTGYSMGAKTLLSIGFYVRNMLSNVLFFGPAQGYWGSFKLLKGSAAILIPGYQGGEYGAKGMLKRAISGTRAETDSYLSFLQGLGVFGNEIRSELMIRLMRGEETMTSVQEKLNELSKVINNKKTPASVAREAKNMAARVASAMDSFYKIGYFENERAVIEEAAETDPEDGKYRNMSASQRDKLAADIVTATAQSYDRAPPIIKKITSGGIGLLLAPFIRFTADIPRISVNTVKQIRKELADSNSVIKRRGANRLAGFTLVVGVFSMVVPTILRTVVSGIGEEEDEALRESLPSYLKNHTFFYFKAGGKLRSLDLTYMNPFSVLVDPTMRFTEHLFRGEPIEGFEKLVTTAIFDPYLGDQIFAGAVFDVKENRDAATDKPIVEDTDPFALKTGKRLMYVLKEAYGPRTPAKVIEASKAAIEGGHGGGLDSPLGMILSEGLPVVPRIVDPARQFERSIYAMRGEYTRARQRYNELLQNDAMLPSEAADLYIDTRDNLLRINSRLHRTLEGFRKFMSDGDMYRALRKAKYGDRRVQLAFAGYGERYLPNPELAKRLMQTERGEKRLRALLAEAEKDEQFIPLPD